MGIGNGDGDAQNEKTPEVSVTLHAKAPKGSS